MPKILVVDDDELTRHYLATLLQRGGYEACAVEGRGALALLAEEPDVAGVVTDLYMPGVDGIEIVMALKRRFPRIPIVGMTGGRSVMDEPCIAAMIRLGAAAVLRKPIEREELFGILGRLVGAPAHRSAPQPA